MVFKQGDIPWNKGIHGKTQTVIEIREKNRMWYHKTKFNRKNHKKTYTDKIRKHVIEHYSPTLRCVCCNESEYEFLTIDHISNKNEYGHSEKIKGGWNLINWIYQNNFPSGFRVLCWNCNSGRGKRNTNGVCPHEKRKNDWEWEL